MFLLLSPPRGEDGLIFKPWYENGPTFVPIIPPPQRGEVMFVKTWQTEQFFLPLLLLLPPVGMASFGIKDACDFEL